MTGDKGEPVGDFMVTIVMNNFLNRGSVELKACRERLVIKALLVDQDIKVLLVPLDHL